ncbi:hypothetical protein ACROYT_G026316 [Oculina patagonica]
MFQPDFEKREENRRKRPASDSLEHQYKRAKYPSSTGWTKHLHYSRSLDRHDHGHQGSSRKTRESPALSTSWGWAEDRHSRGSQRDKSVLNFQPWRSTYRQDGSQRARCERYAVSSTGNSTFTSGGYDIKRRRSQLPDHLFQDATEKTTVYREPAARYQRFDPRSKHLLGETSRSGTTEETIRHEPTHPAAEKTTVYRGPAARYQRSHPPSHILSKPHLGETSRSGAKAETIRHELTEPAAAAGVKIVYTKDALEAERWLRKHIVDCSARAVGFDIEWKPQFVSKKKGGTESKTAVLQLGVEASCLVLHIYHMSELPRSLVAILTDEKVLKIGSGIKQDASKLTRDRGVVCTGFIDTQEMAKSLPLSATGKIGLKALAERFLGIELRKPKRIAMSNWENFPLKLRQIEYAALDAWIGLKIYQEMEVQKRGRK